MGSVFHPSVSSRGTIAVGLAAPAEALMRTFDLVLFDNDGVLVDSEPHAIAVLTELVRGYGLPLSYEESFELFVGSSLGRVRKIAQSRLGRALPEDFENRYYSELFQRFRNGLKAIPGVERALGAIGSPKCVASSGPHERIRLTLELTGLWPLFEGKVFSREDVEHGKPAPDLFLFAARSLGASPNHCAVIEDSPLGIEAANAAGMVSFGFAASTPDVRLSAATGGVFSRMEELPSLLAGAR